MIQFGKTLREAREAKGFTIAQIAEQTHMMSATVQDLENEDFTRLAAPIYGRGFVKLYCEAVGLDPKPLVAEFMDLYNGNHEPTIRERPVSPQVPEPIAEPDPAEPAELEPSRPEEPSPFASAAPAVPDTPFDAAAGQLDAPDVAPTIATPAEASQHVILQPGLFDPPGEPRPAPPPPLYPPESQSDPLMKESADAAPKAPEMPGEPAKQTFARYASPLSDHHHDMRDGLGSMIPWRWAAIGVTLLLVLWGVVVGLKTLYRATSDTMPESTAGQELDSHEANAPRSDTAPAVPATAQPAAKTTAKPATAPAKKTGRTPQNIPPLYLD